jgi:putative ABC transport system permease protein
MKYLPLIVHNLLRNRRRTALTVTSIAISIFIFAALMSLPALIDQVLRDRAGSLRLVCYNKAGFFFSLPSAYQRRVESVPHVEEVAGESLFMGTYRDPNDLLPSAAIDPDHVREIWPDWGITPDAATAFASTRSGALVSGTLMRRYRWRVGSQIILRGTIYPIDVQLTIVGTLGDKAPPVAVLFQREYLDEALGRPGTINLIWVKVDRSQSIPGVIAGIDERFANSSAETRTETEYALSISQMGGFSLIFQGAKVLAAIVMFAIALVAANTAAMAMRERRKELAVMRAVGFPNRTLFWCIVAEGFAIGIAGWLFGSALAWAGLRLVPYASQTLGVFALVIRLRARVVAESLAFAAAIGLLAGIVPAMLVLRREVVSEIRAVV